MSERQPSKQRPFRFWLPNWANPSTPAPPHRGPSQRQQPSRGAATPTTHSPAAAHSQSPSGWAQPLQPSLPSRAPPASTSSSQQRPPNNRPPSPSQPAATNVTSSQAPSPSLTAAPQPQPTTRTTSKRPQPSRSATQPSPPSRPASQLSQPTTISQRVVPQRPSSPPSTSQKTAAAPALQQLPTTPNAHPGSPSSPSANASSQQAKPTTPTNASSRSPSPSTTNAPPPSRRAFGDSQHPSLSSPSSASEPETPATTKIILQPQFSQPPQPHEEETSAAAQQTQLQETPPPQGQDQTDPKDPTSSKQLIDQLQNDKYHHSVRELVGAKPTSPDSLEKPAAAIADPTVVPSNPSNGGQPAKNLEQGQEDTPKSETKPAADKIEQEKLTTVGSQNTKTTGPEESEEHKPKTRLEPTQEEKPSQRRDANEESDERVDTEVVSLQEPADPEPTKSSLPADTITQSTQEGVIRITEAERYVEKEDDDDDDDVPRLPHENKAVSLTKNSTTSSKGKESKVAISTMARTSSTSSDCREQQSTNTTTSLLQKEIKDGISRLVQNLAVQQQQQQQKHSKVPAGSGGHGISIITLAGENKGASMHVGQGDHDTTTKEGSASPSSVVHVLHKGSYEPIKQDATTTRDRTDGRKEQMIDHTSINSNVQSINNSILQNSSCGEKNPGVHLVLLSTKPAAEPAPVRLKDKTEPPDVQKATTSGASPAQKLTYEPTVRRRCLRGLFMESSESEQENGTQKPRRHGCRYSCEEKKKAEADQNGSPAVVNSDGRKGGEGAKSNIKSIQAATK